MNNTHQDQSVAVSRDRPFRQEKTNVTTIDFSWRNLHCHVHGNLCIPSQEYACRVSLNENIAIKVHSQSERCVSRFAKCAESSSQWSIERTSKERRFTASSFPEQTFGQRLD